MTIQPRRFARRILACAVLLSAAPCAGQEAVPDAGRLRLPEPGVALGEAPLPAIAIPDNVAAPGSPAPTTLQEFVGIAERSHPRLRSALAAVEAARGKAVQARLYPNPMLAGSSPQIAGDQSQWNGFATQDIVTAGKLRLSQQAALREVQKAEYELIRARFDVITGVRSTYYQLLVAQRRMEIYRLLLDIAKRSYEIGRQLADAGEGTKADVLFWSIERDRAEVRLLNGSVYVETGRRQLAAAIGLPRADIGTIEADLFLKLPDFELKDLQQAVVFANAKPRAAEAGIAQAQWALERAVVEPIPDINILGGYQYQVGIPAMDQGLMQVMLEVPLFDRNQGNIRAARADIASARAGLRTVELDLANSTAETIAAYRAAQRNVEWFEEYILPKARETVELTQKLYGRGEVTFLSLLQAQRILTETELAFIDSQSDRWASAVAIADLLQLEIFPPTLADPAARPDDDRDELELRGRAPRPVDPAAADGVKPLPAP